MKPSTIVMAAVGAGGTGWFYWRMSQRSKLTDMLAQDATVLAVRKGYEVSGKAPAPDVAWVVSGDYAGRAAAALGWFAMTTADEVFPAILSTLAVEKASPQTRQGLAQIRQIMDAAGIKLPQGADQAIQTLDAVIAQAGGIPGVSKPRPSRGAVHKPRPGMA